MIISLLLSVGLISGQDSNDLWIMPSDTFNQKRFVTSAAFAGSTYTAFSIGLYQTWYRQYETSSFHRFNDWNEWNNIDKYGHFYTSYFQGVLCYKGAKWTGLSENKSIITGIVLGSLFQSTIEVMDGFSDKWGFSVPDIAFNIGGIGAFALQQKYWGEQRIHFKVSSYRRDYTNYNGEETAFLQRRADNLFGSSFATRFLKDYNAQTLWASINVHSFLNENSKFPPWLNIAVGTGSENLFGGYENKWTENETNFQLNEMSYPRYNQFFLGLDVDLTRLPIKNPYLRSFLEIFNIFKIPGPAIEINTLGQVKFHFIHL